MSFLAPLLPITLRGQHVTLEPLVPGHAAEAREAVQDGDVWKLWYTAVPTPCLLYTSPSPRDRG